MPSPARAEPAERMSFVGDVAALQEWLVDQQLTDGLPVNPPTEDAVAAMVAAAGEAPDEPVGEIPPLQAPATVEHVAANAVMAGCAPEHFRTVLAAIRALLDPAFNLYLIQTTTHPVAPLVIVHGPEARRIGVNGGTGVLGPGFRANAAIGRAIRLVLLNLGDGKPGLRDWSTIGAPSKFAFCMTENVEASPWPELHTTRGFRADESAVTVFGCEGPQAVNDHESTTPRRNLDLVASVMSHRGANNWYASDTKSNIVVVLGPEHAAMAADAGWSRTDVQRYLHHRARLPVRALTQGGQWDLRTWSPWMNAVAHDPDALVPIVETADDILVLVAGGPGKWSAVMPSMGNVCVAVTKPIPTDT
jgi:hypothetical protein